MTLNLYTASDSKQVATDASTQTKDEPGDGKIAEKETDKKTEEKEKEEGKEEEEDKDEEEDADEDGPKGEEKGQESDDDGEAVENPWNAVCVIGLRVYSKHAETEVETKSANDADGASLQVDKSTPAGATS
jgi:hypothetical protein